jgi:hypothetical protein
MKKNITYSIFDEHKLKASLVVWSRIDRGRKVLEHYIVTWKGNRDFFHLSQLNWPSLANALSGIEEGVLKLAAQAASCESNKTGW